MLKKVKTHIGKFMSAEKQRAEIILHLKAEEAEAVERESMRIRGLTVVHVGLSCQWQP